MTDNQITVGVLGTGRMGRVHLTAWARVRDEGLSVASESYLIRLALYGRDPANGSRPGPGVRHRANDHDAG